MSEPSSARPIWHWLILLLPGVEVLALTASAEPLARLFFSRQDYGAVSVMLISLALAALLCFAIGLWWAGAYWRRGLANHVHKLNRGILISFGLLVLNGGIAYAGCAITLFR